MDLIRFVVKMSRRLFFKTRTNMSGKRVTKGHKRKDNQKEGEVRNS